MMKMEIKGANQVGPLNAAYSSQACGLWFRLSAKLLKRYQALSYWFDYGNMMLGRCSLLSANTT